MDIQKEAMRIRVMFEEQCIPEPVLVSLYRAYNPFVDAVLFVAEAKKIFPRLNCGLTSVYLQSVLGGRVVQGKYKEQNHTFLLLSNNDMVDITADQYGGPTVYVGPLTSPWAVPV